MLPLILVLILYLVSVIATDCDYFFIGSLKDIRPEGWALSEGYLNYIQDNSEDLTWIPEHDYYVKLIGRFVDSIL